MDGDGGPETHSAAGGAGCGRPLSHPAQEKTSPSFRSVGKERKQAPMFGDMAAVWNF
jgi:hypothetical protein